MYASGSKKMLNMMILEILRTHTDEEHRLTQQEIIRLMKLMYGVTCDRRSVRSNIEALQEMGYEIEVIRVPNVKNVDQLREYFDGRNHGKRPRAVFNTFADADRMPTFAMVTATGSTNARFATKIAIVKPMPPSSAAPTICAARAPDGRPASPDFTVIRVMARMQACSSASPPAFGP